MARVMAQANMKGRSDRFERDRDEELSFFRELRKRQNEHNPSLLHCASEEYEFDPNGGSGKFSLYRIPSGRKEYGLEFLETNKSDFDWLKTPPATPLFPSLEMEPSAQLVTQKEIPISQPISRPNDRLSCEDKEDREILLPRAGAVVVRISKDFSNVGPREPPIKVKLSKSDVEALKPKAIDGKANHSNSTKSKLPKRSITPSHNRQRQSSLKNTNEQQPHTHSTTTKQNSNTKKEHDATSNTKHSTPQKQTNNADFLALNTKKSIEANESHRKPRTRGVSPSVKSRAAADIVIELSNEAPPNLRTDTKRPSSSTRGRSTTRASTVVGFQNTDPTPKACRPSRSPSPSMSNVGNWNQLTQKNWRTQKETFTLSAGSNESRSHFKGSKMVEKVVNARKSSISQVDREAKPMPIKYREK